MEMAGIKVGQDIPKERWEQALDDIIGIGEFLIPMVRKINHEGQGEQDAKDIIETLQLAILALRFVVANATDVVRVIVVPEGSTT